MVWASFSFPFQNYFYGKSNEIEKPVVYDSHFSSADIKQHVLQSFECFKKSWDIPDFWKSANTADACLVMLDTLLTKNPYDPQVNVGCEEFKVFLKIKLQFFIIEDKTNKWIDDFGWWGLLGINAHNFLIKFDKSNLAAEYLDVSIKCHRLMAELVDKNKTLPVPFGCRNSTEAEANTGTKNTVVNALLLLLSTKLYMLYEQKNLDGSDEFLVAAYNQWLWFSAWFKLEKYEYLKSFIGDRDAALVCERPLSFDDGSTYQSKVNPTWTPNWVWTGDQGLLLGSLLNLASMKDKLAAYDAQHDSKWKFDANAFHDQIVDVTKKLIRGVQKGFIGVDGIIYEPPCEASYSTNPDDYFGGRGILVRYMGLLQIRECFKIDLEENILKTVEALWAARNIETNQFQAEYATQDSHLAYAKAFDSIWGFTDQFISWGINSNPLIKNPICQAVGMDFLAALLILRC